MIKNYKLSPSCHLGSEGNAFAFEPPSHPRYFVRAIYTRHGNSPAKGAQYFLNGMGFNSLEEVDKLYNTPEFPRLPLDHPRTRAWIIDLYRHCKNCYNADSRSANDCTIYPVPAYKLKRVPAPDPRYKDEYNAQLIAEAEAHNRQIIEQAQAIATPDNHLAVKAIRKYYPEYQPEPELIENPPQSVGNWYTTGDQPSPTECKGQYGHAHPVNGNWCQWCGWHADTDK